MVSYLWDNLFRRNQRDQQVVEILGDNYIFKELSALELSFIQSLVHYRTYRAGETVFRQGEVGVGMYIVVKGCVNISVEDDPGQHLNGKSNFVTRLNQGDFFGEIALVEQTGRRTATATAAGELVLLGFFKPDLAEIIERSPKTGVKIVTRLAEVLGRRLKETAERFSELKRELKEMDSKNAST